MKCGQIGKQKELKYKSKLQTSIIPVRKMLRYDKIKEKYKTIEKEYFLICGVKR